MTLIHQGAYLNVDDQAYVGEIGLQMFDSLTVSLSCLNGGMLGKNSNDGSDIDENSSQSVNTLKTPQICSKKTKSSQIEPSKN